MKKTTREKTINDENDEIITHLRHRRDSAHAVIMIDSCHSILNGPANLL